MPAPSSGTKLRDWIPFAALHQRIQPKEHLMQLDIRLAESMIPGKP